MKNRGAAIRYGDVAPEAKENFVPGASEQESFVDLTQLQRYNLEFQNFANPCELYQTVLDGTAPAFPSVPEDYNIGLWSTQISNDDGTFDTPIVLTLEAEGQYSSQGITLTFDNYNGIFANLLNIKWYRITSEGIEPLSDMDFTPTGTPFFCRNKVDNYNKVVITFKSINMPKNRLKLRVIDYGYGTFFYGDELRGVKLIQELNPLSSEIAINTADFTLDSKSDMEYSFQTRQPLSIYFNGALRATTFVKSSKRKAKRLWEVQSEDYIGLMDSISYYGGMYIDADAYDVLVDIFTVAKVPYTIDEAFKGIKLNGYIPYTTCREALMQVTFAIGAVVDTSNSDSVKVFSLSDELAQSIPLSRIMQGQSFTDEDTVTDVEVTAHTYTAISETSDVYKASDSGTGTDIFVTFSEPLHDLSITNGAIVSSGVNYAIINAEDGCVLKGQKYEHNTAIKRQHNPIVLASEIEKIVLVDNATLVSSANIDTILSRCFDWLIKVNTTNLKIVEGKHVSGGDIVRYGQAKYGTVKYGGTTPKVVSYDKTVNVGDLIESETEYLGNVTGRVIKQIFNLNGGIIVKDTVLK